MSTCILATASHHSNDTVTIWHGLSTPATACGFHAMSDLPAIFRAHHALLKEN